MRKVLLFLCGVSLAGAWKPMLARPVKAFLLSTACSYASLSGLGVAPAQAASSFEAVCLGFGCGPYQGLDRGSEEVNPLALKAAEREGVAKTITFREFLELVDGGKVASVELRGPVDGDACFAMIVTEGGATEKVFVGAGFPREDGKGWSSPLWAARILENKRIPYTYKIDFGGAATGKSVKPLPNKSY